MASTIRPSKRRRSMFLLYLWGSSFAMLVDAQPDPFGGVFGGMGSGGGGGGGGGSGGGVGGGGPHPLLNGLQAFALTAAMTPEIGCSTSGSQCIVPNNRFTSLSYTGGAETAIPLLGTQWSVVDDGSDPATQTLRLEGCNNPQSPTQECLVHCSTDCSCTDSTTNLACPVRPLPGGGGGSGGPGGGPGGGPPPGLQGYTATPMETVAVTCNAVGSTCVLPPDGSSFPSFASTTGGSIAPSGFTWTTDAAGGQTVTLDNCPTTTTSCTVHCSPECTCLETTTNAACTPALVAAPPPPPPQPTPQPTPPPILQICPIEQNVGLCPTLMQTLGLTELTCDCYNFCAGVFDGCCNLEFPDSNGCLALQCPVNGLAVQGCTLADRIAGSAAAAGGGVNLPDELPPVPNPLTLPLVFPVPPGNSLVARLSCTTVGSQCRYVSSQFASVTNELGTTETLTVGPLADTAVWTVTDPASQNTLTVTDCTPTITGPNNTIGQCLVTCSDDCQCLDTVTNTNCTNALATTLLSQAPAAISTILSNAPATISTVLSQAPAVLETIASSVPAVAPALAPALGSALGDVIQNGGGIIGGLGGGGGGTTNPPSVSDAPSMTPSVDPSIRVSLEIFRLVLGTTGPTPPAAPQIQAVLEAYLEREIQAVWTSLLDVQLENLAASSDLQQRHLQQSKPKPKPKPKLQTRYLQQQQQSPTNNGLTPATGAGPVVLDFAGTAFFDPNVAAATTPVTMDAVLNIQETALNDMEKFKTFAQQDGRLFTTEGEQISTLETALEGPGPRGTGSIQTTASGTGMDSRQCGRTSAMVWVVVGSLSFMGMMWVV